MKLNAVSVSAKDISKSVSFYEILGFKFEKHTSKDQHVEAPQEGGVKLMIDSEEMVESIMNKKPVPGNHSSFAILYDDPEEVNKVVKDLQDKGFEVIKEPWDAFWGQRYAIVQDPNGYLVDLYAYLKK